MATLSRPADRHEMSIRPIILVVEDDAEMNQLERELLEVNGLDSIPAYSGLEALRLYEQRPADAVLLDIMLPELDGLETCRRLRAINAVRVPIIIVTALDSDDCRREGEAAGADAYFAKPFDPEGVVETLRRLIDQNHRSVC